MAHGLYVGMSYSDARAFCPKLISEPANLIADQRFFYTPWPDGHGNIHHGLGLTGMMDYCSTLAVAPIYLATKTICSSKCINASPNQSRPAYWDCGYNRRSLGDQPLCLQRYDCPLLGRRWRLFKAYPIASLRLSEKDVISFRRLGINTIEQMLALPRKNINHRFAPDVLEKLDQAMGWQSEALTPIGDPPNFGARLRFPDPIGLQSDVMAGLDRLLGQLTEKLKRFEYGTHHLRLTIRKVDQADESTDLKLARPMRDPARLLKLFERGVEKLDAGYGIDQMHLRAVGIEALPVEQIGTSTLQNDEALDDLITRIGSRIGIENIVRFLPQSSHTPERCYSISPAAWSRPVHQWPKTPPRPLCFFSPELIEGNEHVPPPTFRWRRMVFAVKKAIGPERIAPEWWGAGRQLAQRAARLLAS